MKLFTQVFSRASLIFYFSLYIIDLLNENMRLKGFGVENKNYLFVSAQICPQYLCKNDTLTSFSCYVQKNPLLFFINECSYDNYCELKSGNCRTKAYSKYRQYNGAACNDDSDCLYGRCSPDSKICLNSIPEKPNCKNNNDCKIGFFCNSTSTQCETLKKINETCINDEDCEINTGCLPEKNTCVAYFSQGENTIVNNKQNLCESGIAFENSCSSAKLISEEDCSRTGYCVYFSESKNVTFNKTESCNCGYNPYGGKLCDFGADNIKLKRQIEIYKSYYIQQNKTLCHTSERLKLCVASAFDSNYNSSINKSIVNSQIDNEISNQKSNQLNDELIFLYADKDFLFNIEKKTNVNVNFQKNDIQAEVSQTTHHRFEYDKKLRLINNQLTLNSKVFSNNTEDYCGFAVMGEYSNYIIPPQTIKACPKYQCDKNAKSCFSAYNPNNYDSSGIVISLNPNVCNNDNLQICDFDSANIFHLENYNGKCIDKPTPPKRKLNRYPGEVCDDDTDCINKLCIYGKCYARKLDETCNNEDPSSSHFCGLGLHCGKHNSSSTEDTCLGLKEIGTECTNSFECGHNLICYSGVCSKELFSIKDNKQVFVKKINDDFISRNPSYLCESGYYDTEYEYCVNYTLLNKTNSDGYAECDVADSNSCVYEIRTELGVKTFKKKCECGYNPDAKAYCPIDYKNCNFSIY